MNVISKPHRGKPTHSTVSPLQEPADLFLNWVVHSPFYGNVVLSATRAHRSPVIYCNSLDRYQNSDKNEVAIFESSFSFMNWIVLVPSLPSPCEFVLPAKCWQNLPGMSVSIMKRIQSMNLEGFFLPGLKLPSPVAASGVLAIILEMLQSHCSW